MTRVMMVRARDGRHHQWREPTRVRLQLPPRAAFLRCWRPLSLCSSHHSWERRCSSAPSPFFASMRSCVLWKGAAQPARARVVAAELKPGKRRGCRCRYRLIHTRAAIATKASASTLEAFVRSRRPTGCTCLVRRAHTAACCPDLSAPKPSPCVGT